jgi:hypothetical protein
LARRRELTACDPARERRLRFDGQLIERNMLDW